MVTKFKNLSWLHDSLAMETPIVLNTFPKTNISITSFWISINNVFYTILFVAMVTKFNNLSWFNHFVVKENTVVLNNFPKPNIFITSFWISIKHGSYTILFVAMVTKFNDLSWFYDCVAMETIVV